MTNSKSQRVSLGTEVMGWLDDLKEVQSIVHV